MIIFLNDAIKQIIRKQIKKLIFSSTFDPIHFTSHNFFVRSVSLFDTVNIKKKIIRRA